MTSTPIPFLLTLAGLALAAVAVVYLSRWWRGADLPDLRCVCGHRVSLHHLSDNVNDLEPCLACACPHWATEDVTRTRGVAVPRDHGVTDFTPLYDQDALADEYRDLCDRETS